jgi:hypothetical protein
MNVRMAVGGLALTLLLWGPLATLEAQVVGPGPDGRWPLQPSSPGNRHLAPFMEGWYENEGGSFSVSFGYLNANDDTLYIPVGENNFLEPAQFNGMQPTIFFPGHHRGLFTAELPAALRDTDVWWTLTKANGDVARVPGRVGAVAYQLDWIPRPHGSVTPLVSFDSQDGEGRGPTGLLAERTMMTSVGSPITLSINTSDPSERDEADFRFAEAIPLRVVWSQLQGPGRVEYTRHESNPLPEVEVEEPDSATAAAIAAGGPAAAAFRRQRQPPGPEVIPLEQGEGTASVIVTFSQPGEYLMLAQVDNHAATDSGRGDQCCWTNGFVKVTVTP